jgi:hypothetical protein
MLLDGEDQVSPSVVAIEGLHFLSTSRVKESSCLVSSQWVPIILCQESWNKLHYQGRPILVSICIDAKEEAAA